MNTGKNTKNNARKKTCKQPDYSQKSNLEEQIATMLENEYGEDTDVLELIEELEKTPEEKEPVETQTKEDDQSDVRKCRNCGIEALFINAVCSECGHKLSSSHEEPDEEAPDDETDFSGYNTDDDE